MGTETEQLIGVLTRLANSLEQVSQAKYTITGAADWSILVTASSVFACIVAVMYGLLMVLGRVVWIDIKSSISSVMTQIKENRCEWVAHLNRHDEENAKDLSLLWNETRTIRGEIKEHVGKIETAMKECKEKCCE